MTAHIPTVTVLLDDGSGTYPIDVSGRVNLSASIGTQGHGRTDEFAQAAATTFSCTLKNDDGLFSAGALAWDSGPWDSGPWGGGIVLTPGQGIRYQQTFGATTVNRFTGRISEAALGFTSVGKASAMAITAVDPLASLARRPLRSMLEQEILLENPTAYYTLGEAEGSTSAGDTSGNFRAPLTTTGNGPPVIFGSVGPVVDLSAVSLTGGQYLTNLLPTGGFPGTGSWSFEFFISGPTPAVSSSVMSFSGINPGTGAREFIAVNLLSSGLLSAALFTGGVSSTSRVGDSNEHHIAVTFDGTNLRLYVDGSLQASSAQPHVGAQLDTIRIGFDTLGNSFVGTFSGLACYASTVLSPSSIASHASALTGFSETTAARFTRLASYVGMTVSAPANSGQLVGPQDTSGSNALDALQAVATSEGGVMFANGSGTLVMQGRGYRAERATADLTVAGKDIDVGTTVPLDDQQIVNQVTVSRQGGATQTYPTDLSLGSVDRFPQSLDLIVTTDDDALAAAQWLANKHATAIPRIGSATVRLLTSSQAEQLMAAEIGDRWALSAMPTQLWAGAGDLTLEGWSETLTVTSSSAEWSMTANLLPFSIFAAALYDDAGSLYDTAGDVYAY